MTHYVTLKIVVVERTFSSMRTIFLNLIVIFAVGPLG